MARWLGLFLLTNTLWATPEVGYKAGQVHPNFHLPRLDGVMGKLSDLRGKKVFLFNFASW